MVAKKGVSPAVSYVMILALVVVLSIASYIWGNYEISKLEDVPLGHNIESQMVTIDQLIDSVSHGDLNFTTVLDVYYSKGVLQVDEANDWIKYSGQINANVYDESESTTSNTTCCDNCYAFNDTSTSLQVVKMQGTNVYRGSTGGETQYVEMIICYDDIDIQADTTCIGKSGPSAQLSARKTGFNATKPIVQVKIC